MLVPHAIPAVRHDHRAPRPMVIQIRRIGLLIRHVLQMRTTSTLSECRKASPRFRWRAAKRGGPGYERAGLRPLNQAANAYLDGIRRRARWWWHDAVRCGRATCHEAQHAPNGACWRRYGRYWGSKPPERGMGSAARCCGKVFRPHLSFRKGYSLYRCQRAHWSVSSCVASGARRMVDSRS